MSEVACRISRPAPEFLRVLAWEFGDRLLNEPRFGELVKDVQQAFGQDAETLERFVRSLTQD